MGNQFSDWDQHEQMGEREATRRASTLPTRLPREVTAWDAKVAAKYLRAILSRCVADDEHCLPDLAKMGMLDYTELRKHVATLNRWFTQDNKQEREP